MTERTPDFLVVGGGIFGLSIARALKRRVPGSVLLLEKEPSVGAHGSGRNSGVLHAGFYYSADSLKARFSRQGNAALAAYCEEKGLTLRRTGKLVVARTEAEHQGLDELLRRARANGVILESIDEQTALKLEPRARTVGRALLSPSTCTVDPAEVMSSLATTARREGVVLHTSEAFVRREGNQVVTTKGRYTPGYLVNAAGLYADQLARQYGFGKSYRILPFQGRYLYSDEPAGSFRHHVYPVPDLRNPFLGVHLTVTVDGRYKLGPSALPALWREQYGGLEGFEPLELLEVAFRGASLWLNAGFDFRSLAREEFQKRSRQQMVALAAALVCGLPPASHFSWGKPGIRAQLVDLRGRRLEMDFVVEGDEGSMHVLNAVSPGFTCALPFADYLVDRILTTARPGSASPRPDR